MLCRLARTVLAAARRLREDKLLKHTPVATTPLDLPLLGLAAMVVVRLRWSVYGC